MAVITKHVRPVINPKNLVRTLLWARSRKLLVLVILAVLAILLATMTPPVMLHQQVIHVPLAQ